MDSIEKLKILSSDSQYDLACACGTGNIDRRHRGLDGKWLYPVSLPNGGFSVMLKTLLSNACSNDCGYCPLRSAANARRCTLAPEEAAKVFMDYHRSGQVFGLFLSSGVAGSPDDGMDKLNATARILRSKHKFRGYIHLKILPGASDAAVEDAISLASAVSLNIETAGEKRFQKLSKSKDYLADIIRPIKLISKLTGKGQRHHNVKATTQFIVGASDESDGEIIKYSFGLYKRLDFDRVYFSAYQAGLGAPDIPGERLLSAATPGELLVREHRLYQADFLIRRYKFAEEDFHFNPDGMLDLSKDPKEVWAELHPEFFPVKINSAVVDEILRVPGIGPTHAGRIVDARKIHRIKDLDRLVRSPAALAKILPRISFD